MVLYEQHEYIQARCDQAPRGTSVCSPAVMVTMQPDEGRITSSPKQNQPRTPTQKFLEDHPLLRASRSTSHVSRHCDLHEVD
ncbi:hypothetical protein BDV12DRAFT_174687 [Aspergillus spectabilis]